MPLLFYAFDDVSGTRNLGSLGDEDRYAAQWMNGSGHFDCPWTVSGRQNVMRMIPSERPWLQIIHNLSLSGTNGFTLMIWFKQNIPATPPMPIVDSMIGENMVSWNMWIFPTGSQILSGFYPSSAVESVQNSLYATTWNNLATRVSSNVLSVSVNGSLLPEPVTVGDFVFGNRLNIGRRVCAGDSFDGYVWDGCLSQFMLFDKALSDDELQLWLSLGGDEDF